MIPYSAFTFIQGTRALSHAGVSAIVQSTRVLASCICQQQQFSSSYSTTTWHAEQQHHQQPQLAAQPQSWHQYQQQQQQPWQQQLQHSLHSSSAPAAAPTAAHEQSALRLPDDKEVEQLLQVLLQPMSRNSSWNAQLSPYLMQVNDQLLVQPQAVLLSMVRALHVIRGVLQEDGHVYIVENNRHLVPLVKTAAHSCLNPNMWFYHHTWSPGTLTNYASSRRLFKEAHQPNRRLLAAKGYRMVNPLCPEPPVATAPVPRLSWDDKWLLFRRTNKPGYRRLIEQLLQQEDSLHKFKPAGSLRGTPRNLRLMVFLDSTKNAVAIKEAYNRNIPTIALANTTKDMSLVTYPVLARDFSPNFVHFFLDWIVKIANAKPDMAPQEREKLLQEAGRK